MNTNIVIGPPGTGKTTYLLSIVEQALSQGVAPEKIGFVSFTKKAANEARDRAVARFGLKASSFPYFKTLHALAFKQLGFTRKAVLTNEHLSKLTKILGYDFSFSKFDVDNHWTGPTEGDRLLGLVRLAHAYGPKCLVRYRKAAATQDLFSEAQVYQFAQALKKFKEDNSYLDFTDMLERFIDPKVAEVRCPHLELLCVDEAQDLSPLDWAATKELMFRAKHVLIAGDDDQSIFNFSGADTEQFLMMAKRGPTHVLNQSYRVPVRIQECANRLLSGVKNRVDKKWMPREAVGLVKAIYSLDDVDLRTGEWLILYRHSFIKKFIIAHLAQNKIEVGTRIKFQTIHKAKGGEADNVVLITTQSKKAWRANETDTEKRVWYVGVTRARENLYVLRDVKKQSTALRTGSKYHFEVI